MTPAADTRIQALAARNNAGWCAAVCRSHGIPSTFGHVAWTSARRTPPLYPDAVTLRPEATPADVLPLIDTRSPGCSVKDSFARLDLAAGGFEVLFTAQWIHRPAELPVPAPDPRAAPVSTADELGSWQAAWHGRPNPPDVFRPSLLADPSVLVLALRESEQVLGGAVLNRGAGLVGLSNLFAADDREVADVWAAAVAEAAGRFPGLPLVGYEQASELDAALDCGFSALGTLRVWAQRD